MSRAEFTVALAALDDYSVVEEVHRCHEAQTIRGALEIIIICRTEAALALPPDFKQSYPDIHIVEAGANALLNEAREAGVRRATTPFVLILEDHCLPLADCLE